VEGTPFGRYRLIELLGRGGMGEVWKAFDTATQRVVAVKVLPPQLAADPTFEQRFRREAYTAAGLSDPHVVPIHNFGEIDGRLYVDMRLIEGQDLEHVLVGGPLDPGRAVEIIEQVASALHSAHRAGLVHRDVKPSNILLGEDDFAYLIDFGIARGADETGLTGTGNVVGTWPYMAPERFTTGRSDTRSDIYALTCVLYECLTSSRPFPGSSVEQQIAGHLTAPPPRPSVSRPGVSPQLDAVIAAGMAKDPDERYGTTIELARAARSAITTSVPKPPSLPDPQHTAAGVAPSAPTQARPAEATAEPWAPTQARPAEATAEPWAPTQARPGDDRPGVLPPPDRDTTDQLPDAAPPPWPWWQRKAIVIPIAVILMVAALVTSLIVVSGNEPPPRQNGPLDGTFAVDFGAVTSPNGQSSENAQGGRETWVIKSACRVGGCVATASKVSGSQSNMSTLVLDQIGGRWMAVSATPGTCQNAPTESWETMSLQRRPDATLVGESIIRSTTSCAQNQQVTFTRTGDVQPNVSIADPEAQPSRVASPAKALHGRYKETDTYADGRSAEANFDIQTYCLRTGERCLSYWQNPDDIKALVFAQGRWVLTNTSADSTCQAGGRAHREISLEYPLPQPSQDPITLLTGRGHYTVTGDCPFNSDFDSRVERTGD
jgi:serine/threonine-protein kinase